MEPAVGLIAFDMRSVGFGGPAFGRHALPRSYPPHAVAPAGRAGLCPFGHDRCRVLLCPSSGAVGPARAFGVAMLALLRLPC